jgi:hypothetical protein
MEDKRKQEKNKVITEDKRKQEKNKIKIQLKELQACINKDTNALKGLYEQPDCEYARVQIQRHETRIEEKKVETERLEKRLQDVTSGKLDNIIIEEREESSKIHTEKLKAKRAIKFDLIQKKEKETQISKRHHELTRQSDRDSRYLEKSSGKSYEHFLRACDTVPEYMRKNLKSMPNNKGYIWKSVWCMGELPEEPGDEDNITIFDKQRSGLMVIHEWTYDKYRVYNKSGRDRRTLVHESNRVRR